MRPEYLSKKLTSPIPTKDGGTLRTIQQGCQYMAAISKEREQRRHWQQVRELIDQERRWLSLAHSYEFAERLSRFTVPLSKRHQQKP